LVAGDSQGKALIKIGAKVAGHGRYVAFQMAEVAIPRNLFADILRLIAELRSPLDVASTAKAFDCDAPIGFAGQLTANEDTACDLSPDRL